MRILSALAIAAALALAAPTTAQADAFDDFNDFMKNETGISDFQLTRSEFGPTNGWQNFHAGLEHLYIWITDDYDIYYKAHRDAVPQVFGSNRSGTVYFGKCLTLTGFTTAGNAGPDGICMTPGSILDYTVGGSPAIPGQARECSYTTPTHGRLSHDHSC